MTTVENERNRAATGRQTSASEPPTAPVTAVPAGARRRFGGAKVGAAFFGWLVAIGMSVLLTGLIALALAAFGRSAGAVPFLADVLADATTAGLTGMGTVVVVLAIGYLAGGYVAGRLARFDGARNGLLTWLLGLIVTVLAGVAAAVVGMNTDFPAAAGIRLPAVPVDASTMTVGGAVLLAVTVLITALAAAAGGRLGQRFHRRLDRAAGLG